MPRAKNHVLKLKGINQTEFAKRDGCSQSYVCRAVSEGRLPAYKDGSLDPTLVGTPWRARNRIKKERALELEEIERRAASGEVVAPPDEINGVPLMSYAMSRSEAERSRAIYDAMNRKIDHDMKLNTVGLVTEMQKHIASMNAKVRTKLLALPSEAAPNLIMLKTAPEMQEALLRYVVKALQALTDDYPA